MLYSSKFKINLIKQHILYLFCRQEWKKMRNRYLDTQKKKMKQLKQFLYKKHFNSHVGDKEKSSNKMEMNYDLTSNKQTDPRNTNSSFTPGTIVKIELAKPCPDTKKFKVCIRPHNSTV